MFKREKSAWRAMKRRCTDKNQSHYKQYGAKGIKVCPEWTDSFDQFLLDMGPAPSPGHWLGRRDVRGNYEPGNCLWTTRREQMLRRRDIHKVPWQNQLTPVSLIAEIPGQPSRTTIKRRALAGLNMEHPPAKMLSSRVIWITHKGEALPLVTWGKRLGIDRTTLLWRVNRGLPPEQVLHQGRLPRKRAIANLASAEQEGRTPR